MAWYETFGLMVGMILTLMAIGMPVAFAFLLTDLIGVMLFMGGSVGISQLAASMGESVANFNLVSLPLFVLMGELFFHSGLATRVFDALDVLFGRLPGRLCYVTIAGGTLFATLSGSSIANTAMLGSLMVPEMVKRGYKPHMAMGPILGTGGLAMIIPPSTLAVLLGSLAGIDIGALLIAGIIPGVLLALMYVVLIMVRVAIDPMAAPAYETPRVPLRRALAMVAVNVLPMGLVVFCVVGLILLGVATPSEAAAFGVVGVVILCLLFRAPLASAVQKSMIGTVRISSSVLLIVMGSTTFSQILAFSGSSAGLIEWAMHFALPPFAILLMMFGVLLLLGMFMEQISIMLLTIPVFIPLAQMLGFDLVWFGLIMLLGLEIGLATPPFGLLLFVMHSTAPKGTTLMQVARAALPFVACALLLSGLVMLFPQLALYLPRLMQ